MNIPTVTTSSIVTAINTVLLTPKARKVVVFLAPCLTVTATRRHKPDSRTKHMEILLTIGPPNVRSKQFIKLCQKAGESFPVKQVQIKYYR